jgi:hypothetical protein
MVRSDRVRIAPLKYPPDSPAQTRNPQPQQAGTREDEPWFIWNQQLQDNGCKSGQAEAAERRSCRIECRRFAATNDVAHAGAFLLLCLVFFD